MNQVSRVQQDTSMAKESPLFLKDPMAMQSSIFKHIPASIQGMEFFIPHLSFQNYLSRDVNKGASALGIDHALAQVNLVISFLPFQGSWTCSSLPSS